MHGIEETVARGMCIGCGACTIATRGAIPISLGNKRMYQVDLTDVSEATRRVGSSVCPFSDESPNEDVLRAPEQVDSAVYDSKLGYVTATFAGRVENDEYLEDSSSGGLTSWTINRLMEEGHADAVIKVGRTKPAEAELFEHQVVEAGEATKSRKSYYYATTFADALNQIEEDNRRFIIVGVPCFIRAARALCESRPELKKKLVFFIGLVCGHFKTQAFAESMAWQVGVPPHDLQDVDFRVKNPHRRSSDYDFGAQSRNTQEWHSERTVSLVGGNWGHNAFQPEACNFCDDVVGETADVSFGDAWLPKYTADPRGMNIVISRNPLIDKILQEGKKDGAIFLESVSREEAIQTQAGGFRHRREGLSVRLADDTAAGLSVPVKRVPVDHNVVSARRRKLIRQRRLMAMESQRLFAEAVEKSDLRIYVKGMKREIAKYHKIEGTRFKNFLRKFKR